MQEEKEAAAVMFRKIATAYEVCQHRRFWFKSWLVCEIKWL